MPSPSPWRHVYAGGTFATAILCGVFGGYWVDHRWGTTPWGVLVGALIGVVAGFYNLLREFKDDSAE